MAAISSIFLVLSLVLAVVIGPQTRPWTWGPAMLALGVSVLAGLPVIWKRGKFQPDFGVLAFGFLTAAWFAWRAWISPVADFGQADVFLLCGAVGAFVSIRAINGNAGAERILLWGIALLLLANVAVIWQQIREPGFSPVFRSMPSRFPSGFFAAYNEAANYLIASSMILGAACVCGRHPMAIRIIWGGIAIAGLAAVYATHSRGGILAAAVACGVFAAFLLVILKRRNSRWFSPVVIGVPLIGIGLAFFLFSGWHEAQQARQAGSGIEQLMDNDVRLHLLGVSISCIGLHPWAGGGSMSFAWECFRFWERSAHGGGWARLEMVHNELLQSATDFGLIGTGLLLGLAGTLVISATLRLLFDKDPNARDGGSAWLMGGIAGFAGMLVQSCFSFVFHMMPGTLLLGICFGMMGRSKTRQAAPQVLASRILLSVTAVLCAALILPAGWKGLQVTRILWPAYFSKLAAISTDSRIDALTAAIGIWPQAALYQDRAGVLQELAASGTEADFREFAGRAIEDYREAARLHPFDPGPEINRANLLGYLLRDQEAEEAYARAIALQGGMEPAFRGHFSLAAHYCRKGLRSFDPESPEAALDAFGLAAIEIEKAVEETPPWIINSDGRSLRISIYENLGTAREAVGDREGALQAYDFAASIPTGWGAHYRAGVLIGKMAVEAWTSRQPSEAMKWFIEARRRIGQARGKLPEGVTPDQRAEYLAYLDRTIQFLKGAKVEPAR